ncbi:MAG TPA: BTAD domain-containing putative transcriptional regulator [Streptosporangiaceae bacterium]|nr:BTAD domain-containing putative transcriptional regulator [Streptosporangiaceae bacterium]
MASQHDGAPPLAVVAELRRLVLGQHFGVAEQMLTSLRDVGSPATVDTLRQLCVSGAEQLRIASELDSAARAQRLLAQEVQRGIEAILASWERHITMAEEEAGALAVSSAPHDGKIRRRRWWAPRPGSAGSAETIAQAAPAPAEPAAVPGAEVAACVLGPLDLTVAGNRVLRWNSLKARTVFQYLVVQIGRPVRREVLMELMWPDHSLGSARNNLNAALYSLRNTLDQRGSRVPYILYKDGCYLPNPELMWWIDRTEFLSTLQRAEVARRGGQSRQAANAYLRAVRLYRGPLFEDDRDGDWYLPEQRRLKELYLQAVECLAEIHLEQRDLTAAVRFGQLALLADQCCEPAHRLLMRCYAQQNQQQLVSRQYLLCSDALQDELGVSPGADTVRLLHSLTSRA